MPHSNNRRFKQPALPSVNSEVPLPASPTVAPKAPSLATAASKIEQTNKKQSGSKLQQWIK